MEGSLCANVEFSVPWGHISGKLWGRRNGQPVLALHGIMDNCGVFDRLIPMLKGDFYILAIDLPGHGLSSHFPSGVPLSFFHFITAIKYVIDEMRWKQFFIIGHSLGALFAQYFSACFPQLVKKLIILDAVATKLINDDNIVANCRRWVTHFIESVERQRGSCPPVYSQEEALNRLRQREDLLSEEATEILTKRSLKETEKGYEFRMDQRLKLDILPFLNTKLTVDCLQNLRCPVLFIFSSERYLIFTGLFGEIMKVINENPNNEVKVIENVGHEFHQNSPEKIVKFVDEFFLLERCKQ